MSHQQSPIRYDEQKRLDVSEAGDSVKREERLRSLEDKDRVNKLRSTAAETKVERTMRGS